MRWRTVLLLLYVIGTASSSLLLLDEASVSPAVSAEAVDRLSWPLRAAAGRWVPDRVATYLMPVLESPLGTVLAVLGWVLAVLLAASAALSLVRRARRLGSGAGSREG